jgi:hypothetical protein
MAVTSERFAEELRGLVAERRAHGLETTPVEQITEKAA